MKFVVKGSIILVLTGLFIYQSWRTIRKYQAKNTSLQVTMTDEGSILFPSITVCKDEMYTRWDGEGLFTYLHSGEVSVEEAGGWFKNNTLSRTDLIKFVSVNTVEASNNYPCNAVSGIREGEACSFPFLFPDCQLSKKSRDCFEDPGITSVLYHSCSTEGNFSFTNQHISSSNKVGNPLVADKTFHDLLELLSATKRYDI